VLKARRRRKQQHLYRCLKCQRRRHTPLDLVHMGDRVRLQHGFSPYPLNPLDPSTPPRAPLRWAQFYASPVTQKAVLLPYPTPLMNEVLSFTPPVHRRVGSRPRYRPHRTRLTTPPPTSRLYAIYHTILVVTISFKGQFPPHWHAPLIKG